MSLYYCTPVIPALSPVLLFWLPFSSVHHREYIWQCCFCFNLLFFPNFPPSLPRALSYSQDIKVTHAKDLIKALLSQITTTSHYALLTLTSFDSDLFHAVLFFLSFPLFLTFFLSVFRCIVFFVILLLLFLQSQFFICLVCFPG